MRHFILVMLIMMEVVLSAPTIEDDENTGVQAASYFMPMMNPMFMMRNPMMMMRPPMFMGCSGCTCSLCTIKWMCPPVCSPCCCNNSCNGQNSSTEKAVEEIQDPDEEYFPDMHGPESKEPMPIFPNFPALDEIIQRILDRNDVDEDYFPDMHGPESKEPKPKYPNFPALDKIIQRVLDRNDDYYPEDIIVDRKIFY